MLARPTPIVLADLRFVGLGRGFRITDVFDEEAVGIGQDGEVYLLDLNSGTSSQLSKDGARKFDAVISAEHIAWMDRSRQIKIYYSGSRPPEGFAADIFLMDRETGEVRRITEAPAKRWGLRIHGSRLVWEDNRNEIEEHYTHYDIYAYDIERDVEIPIAVAPGSQRNPAIHGDTVVWADNRNSKTLGTSKSGCGDCPDNRFDIYSYDFATGLDRPLVETNGLNQAPAISANFVAWKAYDEEGRRTSAIHILDRETGEIETVASDVHSLWGPALTDAYLLWTVDSACDVGHAPGEWRNGVYFRSLATDEVRRLSNYVEPRAILGEGVTVITERCMVPGSGRVYAVFLDD